MARLVPGHRLPHGLAVRGRQVRGTTSHGRLGGERWRGVAEPDPRVVRVVALAVESTRRHTDDGEQLTAQTHPLANHARTAKLTHPQRVAQHDGAVVTGDGRAAGLVGGAGDGQAVRSDQVDGGQAAEAVLVRAPTPERLADGLAAAFAAGRPLGRLRAEVDPLRV